VLESVPTVRSVTIGIWVLTGSRNETVDNNGISHFLEHMFFKGTKKRTAQEIAESFDSIGGQVNAFTSKEYTCYYARVLDSYKEYALEVLTDMFFESTFLEEEMEREKKVIKEEIKMYDDAPDDQVHDLLAKAAFGNHALGRPILGTDVQIDRFTRQTLLDHIEQFYTPENVVVSIAGNVDTGFIQKVEDYFDRFHRKGKAMSRLVPVITHDTIEKTKETEQAHLCLGFPGLGMDDQGIPSMLLVNNVLGGGMSSRLFQEIREKRGLAYSVFSYHSSYLDTGLLVIYAGTTKDQLGILETTIDDTIDDLIQNGLTEKEFKNSKAQLKGNMMLRLESTNSRMSRNGRNELLLEQHKTLDEIIREIDGVDDKMIQTMIKQTFQNDRAKATITPL
jgi:predicted Zn-dependent peptidase